MPRTIKLLSGLEKKYSDEECAYRAALDKRIKESVEPSVAIKELEHLNPDRRYGVFEDGGIAVRLPHPWVYACWWVKGRIAGVLVEIKRENPVPDVSDCLLDGPSKVHPELAKIMANPFPGDWPDCDERIVAALDRFDTDGSADELLCTLRKHYPDEPLFMAGGADVVTGTEAKRVAYSCVTPELLAMACLTKHPEWTDARIADEIGVYRTSIYRWQMFKDLRKSLKDRNSGASSQHQKADRRQGRTGKSVADSPQRDT